MDSTRSGRRRRSEDGSMAVEMVLLAPVLLSFVLFVVMCGRYVAVRGDVDAAARDAVRSASLQTSWGDAQAAARSTVDRSLDSQTTCRVPDLRGEWAAGGTLTVDLTCKVSFRGLGLIGVPGEATVSASSSVPLDPYRRY